MIQFTSDTVLAVISGVIAIAVSWGYFRNKVETLWSEISKLRTWKEDHEKDAMVNRSEFERRVSVLDVSIAKKDAQFEEILRRLDAIDNALSRKFKGGN